MKNIILSILTLLLTNVFVFSYTLTETDYSALDTVEDRLFDLMEDRDWDAEYVI
jgi:hypothetical protein